MALTDERPTLHVHDDPDHPDWTAAYTDWPTIHDGKNVRCATCGITLANHISSADQPLKMTGRMLCRLCNRPIAHHDPGEYCMLNRRYGQHDPTPIPKVDDLEAALYALEDLWTAPT